MIMQLKLNIGTDKKYFKMDYFKTSIKDHPRRIEETINDFVSHAIHDFKMLEKGKEFIITIK